MNILDHEQFEGAEELARIGTKIAEGRAILSDLKETKEQFLKDRGQETTERINKVLAESIDLITAIGKNHDSLVEYRREVDIYVEELRYFIETFAEIKKEVTDYVTEQHGQLDQKIEEIQALRKAQQADLVASQIQRQQTRKDMEELSKETRKFVSERAHLSRSWDELKKREAKFQDKQKKHGSN